ncbi:hypothetical protein [Flavobacterium sp. HNIBRBA15423]|uniref:hypothetical protein n=1 Tax=Flavobacterium sp. HNIBRBA15423 TaxID=3458683 RepID=UPI004045023A
MKEYINKIQFPVLDISISDWNGEIINEIIFYDLYFYNSSNTIFKNLRYNHEIVDCKGNLYKIIGIKESKGWRKVFPCFSKREMKIENLNKNITLKDLKDLMLAKIYKLDSNQFKEEWIENIKKANTFEEVIV